MRKHSELREYWHKAKTPKPKYCVFYNRVKHFNRDKEKALIIGDYRTTQERTKAREEIKKNRKFTLIQPRV